MRRLGQTVIDLSRHRHLLKQHLPGSFMAPGAGPSEKVAQHLSEVTGFGTNPGNLRMLTYVPESLSPSSGLVVVLHGCTQTAAGYAEGVGWPALADQYGFALLMPEQRRENNPNLCFNWFESADTRRDSGECLSIAQMVDRMIADHGIDPSRVFVTGLSAGGAMTSVMLATYPEKFAGGAIVAGLPFGAARSVPEAFEAMYQVRHHTGREWGDLARAASGHAGSWPKVSVWHGTADTTVRSGNMDEIVKQWTDLHGLRPEPTLEHRVDGQRRQLWRNARGEDVLEAFTIDGMAHGAPIMPGTEDGQAGTAGAFILDVGISAAHHIAAFWGLTGMVPERAARPQPHFAHDTVFDQAAAPEPRLQPAPVSAPASTGTHSRSRQKTGSVLDPQTVIVKALRAAGLM